MRKQKQDKQQQRERTTSTNSHALTMQLPTNISLLHPDIATAMKNNNMRTPVQTNNNLSPQFTKERKRFGLEMALAQAPHQM